MFNYKAITFLSIFIVVGLFFCSVSSVFASDSNATEVYGTINSDGTSVTIGAPYTGWSCHSHYATGIRWISFDDTSGTISTAAPACWGSDYDETYLDLSSQTTDGTYEYRFKDNDTSVNNSSYQLFARFYRTDGVWYADQP